MPSPKLPFRPIPTSSLNSITTPADGRSISSSSTTSATAPFPPTNISDDGNLVPSVLVAPVTVDAIKRPRRRSSVAKPSAGVQPRKQLRLQAHDESAEGSGSGSGSRSSIDAWDSTWGDADALRIGHTAEDDDDNDAETELGLSASEQRQRAHDRRQRRRHLLRLDERVIEGGVGHSVRELAFDGGNDDESEDEHEGRRGIDTGHDDGSHSQLLMESITDDERREADKTVARWLLLNGTLIGCWYLFSLSISLYNKWMFGDKFPFPLFTTSIHMLVQFLLACLVLYFVPSLRVGADGEDADKTTPGASSKVPRMTMWFYLTRIGPCGAATGLDIGLGNASLKLITLTFYTMCKSSSLAFVLLFAFAFRLEKPTLRLVAIIATMTVGVVMMVAGEAEFNALGFFLVISAAFFSGFRWGLTQILLLRNPTTSNPFSSIFYLAPVMFVVLFLLAVPTEGIAELLVGLRSLASQFGLVRTPLLLIFPGTIAFLMTASEFALLQRTSVVTLSIAGIFKEVVTIVTSMLVFHDTMTLVNVLGLIVTLVAIGVYNYIKITRMRQQAQIDIHKGNGHKLQRQNATPADHPHSLASSSLPPPYETNHENAEDEAAAEADEEDASLLRRPPGESSHSVHG